MRWDANPSLGAQKAILGICGGDLISLNSMIALMLGLTSAIFRDSIDDALITHLKVTLATRETCACLRISVSTRISLRLNCHSGKTYRRGLHAMAHRCDRQSSIARRCYRSQRHDQLFRGQERRG